MVLVLLKKMFKFLFCSYCDILQILYCQSIGYTTYCNNNYENEEISRLQDIFKTCKIENASPQTETAGSLFEKTGR